MHFQREDALRGRTKHLYVSTNPFISLERFVSSIENLISMDANLWRIHFLYTTHALLKIAEISNPCGVSSGIALTQDDLIKGISMARIEIMIRRLLQEQWDRTEELYRQWRLEDRTELKRIIETIIAHYDQSLNATIEKEMISRVQIMS